MCDIACGLQEAGLRDFASRCNASPMSEWAALGLYDADSVEGWGAIMQDTIKKGDFRIAKQIGPRGYFGEVALEVETCDCDGAIKVDFDPHRASRWQSAARFGIDYVLEHLPARNFFPNGGRVFVRCIQGHEVDTSNALIAYVAAEAMLQALGADTAKRPGLDEMNGIVTFPK